MARGVLAERPRRFGRKPRLIMTHADLLAAIVQATRRAVTDRQAELPASALERLASERTPRGRLFRAQLARADCINVVAECKRRSPSRSILRPHYDPADVARRYAAAGAAAVSVLTEPTFFDGALDHLDVVRAAIHVPVLRKDFIVSEYQLLEARAHGADAVLLIVAALDEASLSALLAAARVLGLAVVVEVHDREELARAIGVGADTIGVNNRNLRTLEVSLTASQILIEAIPGESLAVAESGLRTRSDVLSLRRAGYDAFLIGESFMTRPDPGASLRELLGDGDVAPRGPRRGERTAVRAKW